MYPFETPLEHEGLIYYTPEHFYQAMKSTSEMTRELISKQQNGIKAKKVGRIITLRKDWEDIKIKVMFFAQRHRFSDGTAWRTRLQRTDGEIVETNNWHDNYWGNCICNKCKEIEGKNMLGKILMEIRDENKI